NRGTVFTSNDSTSSTFIADNPVFDPNTVETLKRFQNRPLSGWLLFRNGVKYQFDSSGNVIQIQDRNGNVIQLCYSGSPCHQTGDTITIIDALNRAISIRNADFISTFSDTITYPGFNGSHTITISWTPLQNALYPGVCGGSIQSSQTLFPK